MTCYLKKFLVFDKRYRKGKEEPVVVYTCVRLGPISEERKAGRK